MIGEGQCARIILCSRITLKKTCFTVPPVVELPPLHYQESCTFSFADLFLEFLAGFFLYIISIAGRISEAAIGARRPLLRIYEPKKMGARSARARTSGQNPLV